MKEGIIDQYTYTLNVPNESQKGNLVIYKVDAKNHDIIVTDTTFDIFDDSNKLLATIKTDSKGIARLDNINVR
ncbi:MAG: hypothetical protein HFJ52_01725 [Clostridia bacterium]|jgi:hypothetical protein|nr:hypothetical protein [Clostridia bacterium]